MLGGKVLVHVTKVSDKIELVVGWCYGCGRVWVCSGIECVGSGCNGNVNGRWNGHGDIGWNPCKCVGYAFGVGFVDVYSVASVVFECRSEVPSIAPVSRPGLADGWLFVDDNLGAWRCEWCAVEVEETVDESLGG